MLLLDATPARDLAVAPRHQGQQKNKLKATTGSTSQDLVVIIQNKFVMNGCLIFNQLSKQQSF
jgi:hypothetical protein